MTLKEQALAHYNCSKWYGCSKEKHILFLQQKVCVDWELADVES